VKIEFPGIILRDRLYSIEDLQIHCERLIKRNIPEWERNIFTFILDFLSDKDYVEQESSGTTGEKKTYKLTKKAMIESAKLTTAFFNLKFGQKALLCLPIDYIAGKMMIVRALVAGLNLFWEEPSSMPELSNYGKICFCAMVPFQVYNSFSNYEFFKNIDNLIIGGSEMRNELFAMFRDINNKTYETYGMTETCSHIALRRISGNDPEKYFTTLPGVSVEADDRNCLIINAPFLDSPVKTNDVVEIVNNNQFTWKGRFDNLINSGGIKTNPEELEMLISEVIDLEFAVIGIPDEKLGQKIVLVVESDRKHNESEIINLISEVVEKEQVPKEIIYLEKLPRSSSYKIDRRRVFEIISLKKEGEN